MEIFVNHSFTVRFRDRLTTEEGSKQDRHMFPSPRGLQYQQSLLRCNFTTMGFRKMISSYLKLNGCPKSSESDELEELEFDIGE